MKTAKATKHTCDHFWAFLPGWRRLIAAPHPLFHSRSVSTRTFPSNHRLNARVFGVRTSARNRQTPREEQSRLSQPRDAERNVITRALLHIAKPADMLLFADTPLLLCSAICLSCCPPVVLMRVLFFLPPLRVPLLLLSHLQAGRTWRRRHLPRLSFVRLFEWHGNVAFFLLNSTPASHQRCGDRLARIPILWSHLASKDPVVKYVYSKMTNTTGGKKKLALRSPSPPPPFSPPLCLTSVIARSFAVLAWGVDRRRCLRSLLPFPSLLSQTDGEPGYVFTPDQPSPTQRARVCRRAPWRQPHCQSPAPHPSIHKVEIGCQPAGQPASGPGSARTVSLQGQRKFDTSLSALCISNRSVYLSMKHVL